MDEKLQELIDKAEQGDVDAMILVSKYYKNGILTEQDDVKAHEYRLMAAERGDAGSEFVVGMDYCFGFGAEDNLALGLKYLQSAADKNIAQAQFTLASLYDGGNEEVRAYLKEEDCNAYLEKAAKQGHADAQTMLGDMYVKGKGRKRDLKQAAFWFCCAYLHDESDGEAKEKIDSLIKASFNGISKSKIEKMLAEIKSQYPQYTRFRKNN